MHILRGMSDPYRSAPPPPPGASRGGGGWACPRCTAKLGGEELGGVRLDRCIRCEGLFVTVERMSELIDRRDQLDELRALLPRDPGRPSDARPMYLRCPVCATLMNRKQYATGAKVVIDVCRAHGVWFDGGELVRTLDFIAGGGLEQARRRDAQRKDEAVRMDKLRESLMRARHATSSNDPLTEVVWWLE